MSHAAKAKHSRIFAAKGGTIFAMRQEVASKAYVAKIPVSLFVSIVMYAQPLRP